MRDKAFVNEIKETLYDSLLQDLRGTQDETRIGFLIFDKKVSGKEIEKRAEDYEEKHPKCETLYLACYAGARP